MRLKPPQVETFYGRDGRHWTAYLTRVQLLGPLTLHVFHRGDADPDPHDHPRAFVTLPLCSYVEHVFDPTTGREVLEVVRAGRLHFRPARYAHRVLGAWSGARHAGGQLVAETRPGGIVSLVVWLGRKRRPWGFWRQKPGGFVGREFVGWRAYVFGEGAE